MDFTAVRLVGVGLGFSLKKRLEIMTEFKALGKKLPLDYQCGECGGELKKEFHYRQALLEAADLLDLPGNPNLSELAKKLRISAGVEE